MRCFAGEWEASTVTFSANGEPQELDPYYVPDAFRDWGLKLYDWQSQSSTLATQVSIPCAYICLHKMISSFFREL